MKPLIFSLFQPSKLFNNVVNHYDGEIEIGEAILRDFPDSETYLKIISNVKDRSVMVMTSLDRPNIKILPLLFFANTVKDLGAKEIGLVVPYLSYMRQDKRFNIGECLSSKVFAELLSQHFDWLITIDPHLHRYKTLNEIYTIPITTLHAADKILEWIQSHVKNPIIIGPDTESKQWAQTIANKASIPYLILDKIRQDDRDVKISVPKITAFRSHTVVLIDDIISTGKTIFETITILNKIGMESCVCIGVHAVFANDAYKSLKDTGNRIITCNTIDHDTNAIDLSDLICSALSEKLRKK